MKSFTIPMAVMSDSYKAGHFLMYPDSDKSVAYGELRKPYPGVNDARIVFHGIRYIVENYLNRQWTVEEVEQADKFYSTHNAAGTAYPYPKELFLKFIKENNGYFPIKVEALAEGTVIYPHVPVYQITAENEYANLCTFLETLLTHVWYPTTVATLSRHVRTVIDEFFEDTVDMENFWKKDSRLHDFGMRGVTCAEQALIGGVAHLLNFGGSDTMNAAFYAQFYLNGGKPVASSIPATEHSVMTSWKSELEALENMHKQFPAGSDFCKLGIFATVGDSYNYENFLNNIVPVVAKKFSGKFGLWVLRPDSGNPVDCVLQGLEAADKTFGSTLNKKGFKVLNGAAVIQGDGINIDDVKNILRAVKIKGFSVENVAFGMGGGLLQKINRDTLSMATKLSYIRYADGGEKNIMKRPSDDKGKYSLPGEMKVVYQNGIPTVFPIETETIGKSLLKVVYNNGPVEIAWPLFDDIKSHILEQYEVLPKTADPISTQMKYKIASVINEQGL